MRRKLPLLVVVLALAFTGADVAAHARPPEAASAAEWCPCMKFFADRYARRGFRWRMMRKGVIVRLVDRGVSPGRRARLRRAIYDFQANNDFNESFCKRYPKVCRAALACLTVGGGTLLNSARDGKIDATDAFLAGISCADAAATVYLL